VTWTIELHIGSPEERDLTRAPLDLSLKEALAESPRRENAACGACVYEKTTEHGKSHYFHNSTMAVGSVLCVDALPKEHEFYMGSKCSALKFPCKDPYYK